MKCAIQRYIIYSIIIKRTQHLWISKCQKCYWPPITYQLSLIFLFSLPLERQHCIFYLAMFKYHSQGCGWKAVGELLSYLSLSLSLSLWTLQWTISKHWFWHPFNYSNTQRAPQQLHCETNSTWDNLTLSGSFILSLFEVKCQGGNAFYSSSNPFILHLLS